MRVPSTQQLHQGKERSAAGFIVPFLLLLVWELAAMMKLLPPSLSASPSDVAQDLVRMILSGPLLKHALVSLARIFASVCIGGVTGIASGLLLSQSRTAERLLSPTLQLAAPVPVVVWMPFVIMLLGSGEAYKVALASIACYLIVHIHAFRAFKSVERDYLELAEIYEKSPWERFRHVLLPAASPSILTALRLTLGIAWIVIFFVEYGSARLGSEGLGWFIADSRALGRIEDEFAGVTLLALTGFLTDVLLVRFQTKSLDWTDTEESLAKHRELQ